MSNWSYESILYAFINFFVKKECKCEGKFWSHLPLQEYCLKAEHVYISALQLLEAGSKPSTWFPPGGL